jgi:hypothetical protein
MDSRPHIGETKLSACLTSIFTEEKQQVACSEWYTATMETKNKTGKKLTDKQTTTYNTL